MRIVVALGGNALLERGERPDALIQRHHVQRAAESLAPLCERHQLIVCHGNGPQVGLLALESESDHSLSRPYPLDVLGAQTQGMIGYWLAQELHNAGVKQPIVSIITQTVVAASDTGFRHPDKFIGAAYDKQRADALASRLHWTTALDGTHYRRVVPSPAPLRIIEQEAVERLLEGGFTVICGGGGGVPVVQEGSGKLSGTEAVVDKDLTAAKIAIDNHADRLLLLTDVPAVMHGFGTTHATAIRRLSLPELGSMTFPAGSMGPKIRACRQFVEATKSPAAIGALTDAADILAGTAGTTLAPDSRAARPLNPLPQT